jgi:hypothetical protein
VADDVDNELHPAGGFNIENEQRRGRKDKDDVNGKTLFGKK